ncbi:preprotein translocase subunit YajC [Haemophilus parahaemolyticus]|jgi:preprotein translocase, yajC subunit|uniref:Sec translocon accessory complex subunit YajC n=3 Tax=Haemophilus TaxID=724 RepID=A0A369ZXH8_9PAST|nr:MULTISPECIES: preprotein translocase subunit YajC [Haemophilus]EIJ71234.1 preprotein translocase, YajC subunit [Haemophilus parahaemolyticus HK385]MBS6009348.1 preprotein translocase subunit YajC [Haemophilus parahaemolyticus]MDQ6576686.1 preprotein translocase subunit YajC [Haemophilus parahaemolyticus]MDU4464525.1 preprotein translocase subunit YajC [Haemophilus parahaemolyticus]OOR95384.1 preprotein translocase subunit YajC [Haemophilus parahaemolyticus]
MQQGSGLEMLIILAVFGVIFYFMVFRPQSKRQKEQRNLLSSLSKGDEILTSGGLIGKITKVSAEDENIVIALNDNNEVMISRNFVVATLPKGTMKALKP